MSLLSDGEQVVCFSWVAVKAYLCKRKAQSHTFQIKRTQGLDLVLFKVSFEVIKVIHEKLLDMVGKVQVPIMLVGNKKDLHMERVISYEEGKALAESWNAAFLESSAKENQTAVEVFKRIILEAEKIDGGCTQGKSSCSVM
ncbi:GTP-binding protein Rheb [Gastrophryne carolinensis]